MWTWKTVERKYSQQVATFLLPVFERGIIITEDPPLIKMAIPFKSVCKAHHSTVIQGIQVLWWITFSDCICKREGRKHGSRIVTNLERTGLLSSSKQSLHELLNTVSLGSWYLFHSSKLRTFLLIRSPPLRIIIPSDNNTETIIKQW